MHAKNMGKTRNSAAVLIVVATLFATITISEGADSITSAVHLSLTNTTTSTTMTTPATTLKPTTTTNLQTQKSNDLFIKMIEQLMQNPKLIGDFVQSLVPAFTNVLKSSISGSNNTISSSSPTEALLRKLLSGLSAPGSSAALVSGLGRSGAQVMGTVEKYLDKPIVKQTLLPLATRVENILREEVR